MKLIFIRHGQTAWNAARLLQGSTDIPLNAAGLAQAEEQRTLLATTPFDFAIASPLLRARQTAEIICRGRNCRITTDTRLAERSFGTFEGAAFDRAVFDEWWGFGGTVPDSVEQLGSFCRRVDAVLDELAAQHAEQTVLMVAHGGVSIAVQRYFCGEPQSRAEAIRVLPNCIPAVFDTSRNNFEIIG